MAPTEFKLRDLEIDFLDRSIHILVTGPGEPPPIPELVDALRERLEAEVDVDVLALREVKKPARKARHQTFWRRATSFLGIDSGRANSGGRHLGRARRSRMRRAPDSTQVSARRRAP